MVNGWNRLCAPQTPQSPLLNSNSKSHVVSANFTPCGAENQAVNFYCIRIILYDNSGLPWPCLGEYTSVSLEECYSLNILQLKAKT
jgi:hypothetical protein